MLTGFVKPTKPEKEALETERAAEQEKLAGYQMKIKEAGLPVMVIFEGWGTAGKGSMIRRVIRNIDPRFFKVFTMDAEPSEEEKRYPFLHRYLQAIPEAGKFAFFDAFWMEEVIRDTMSGDLSEEGYHERVESINMSERSLTDNGYLVMKFFLDISQEEQSERIRELTKNKNTKWRVDRDDKKQNKAYEDYRQAFDRYLNDTNRSIAPWYIIDAVDKKWAELQVLRYLNQGIATALQNHALAVPIRQNAFPLRPIKKLAEIPLNKTIPDDEYEKELEALQDELRELHNRLYRRRIPVIIAYEGWDAAGKGGNIKRITRALDPRGYVVEPIASPEPHEKARHYLWRFWTRLPKDGHITIFDRTWYGRVMVERLEGFCSENDWQRAYNEINEFENELSRWGAVIIKFWVQIDKDTQLERFTERQNTLEKQWKITDEDWRNREKWDVYESAVDEMLQKTNTEFAPWHILESNDKHYARIKALRIVVKELRKACEKKK